MRCTRLLGGPRQRSLLHLAPDGVWRAGHVATTAGGLLPHRFTLTDAAVAATAVCFLWHCPAGHPGLPLTTTLPCGARTFLGGAQRANPKRTDATAQPTRPSHLQCYVAMDAIGAIGFADVLFLLGAGLAAGIVNAVAGGGSLITFPALVAVGLPPVPANVTNSIAVSPGYLASVHGSRADLAGLAASRGRSALLALLHTAVMGAAAGCTLLLAALGGTASTGTSSTSSRPGIIRPGRTRTSRRWFRSWPGPGPPSPAATSPASGCCPRCWPAPSS